MLTSGSIATIENTIQKSGILLRICAFSVFIGRAWQHLFWDAPYRAIAWNEGLLKGLVESLTNMTWQEYVTSPHTDAAITLAIRGTGVFYLIAALFCLFAKGKNRIAGILWIIGSGLLAILAFLYMKEKFFQVGQFFEYALQVGSPMLLYYWVYGGTDSQKADLSSSFWKKLILSAKILIALTFICHGLYAMGYYPRPGFFVDMTINVFGVSEAVAHRLLWWAGLLDMIISAGIFVPRVARVCLLYAVVWGLLTAFARVVANFYADFPWQSLHQYTFETVYRLPHGLIPLFVFLIIQNRKRYKVMV
ncbi:DoxX-like family protein [Roseivirga sp. BDSF3-8]|uniref:DoxX-like family protein n=1 Tax=Roseivirga sp. BDSF3-8 TaxID=3241598 RepID=UPI003531AE00